MKIAKIFAVIIIFFAFSSCQKNENTTNTSLSKPKLIIGIVVDQMAYNYTERYWSKFSPNGIKKLYTEGYVCKDANFEHFPTYTAPGHTCIYTGTDPVDNGIVANDWYDRQTKKNVYCVEDDNAKTVGSFSTAGEMAPNKMLVTTIGDQMKLTSNFKSKVIGIALKDRGAILPAGHMANSAYWYDPSSKHWISSSYYMSDIPDWVKQFNSKDLPDEYLSHDWNTLLPINEYTESTPDENKYEKSYAGEEKQVFPHKLPELKYRNPTLLQYSPWGNTITKDFAIETIKNENLGKGDNTDLLCISFSSTDYVGHLFGPNSVEIEDTYLRLDRDLTEMFKFIDDYVGMQNVLIFFTADHGASPNPLFMRDNKMDAGTFHYKEILDSSNLYLKMTFGLDSGAVYCVNQEVYLDHDKIDAKGRSLNLIEDSLCAYIERNITGVEKAYASYSLVSVNNDKYASSFFRGNYTKRAGDVFINFRPYWIEESHHGTEHGSPYSYDSHVPLVWYGWKVKPGESGEYTAIKDIVPTLANILNIDVPEKSKGKPIEEVLKSIGK